MSHAYGLYSANQQSQAKLSTPSNPSPDALPRPVIKPTISPLHPRTLVDGNPTIPAGISSTGDSTLTRLSGPDAEQLRKSLEDELKRQLRAVKKLKALQTNRGTDGTRRLRFFRPSSSVQGGTEAEMMQLQGRIQEMERQIEDLTRQLQAPPPEYTSIL